MLVEQGDFHIANLAFLLDYDDGTDEEEIESELFKLLFQVKGTVHYDRENGGNFEDLEQQTFSDVLMLIFSSNLVASVYRLNEEKNFDPYIIVGHTDIESADGGNGKVFTSVKYRLLQNLQSDQQSIKVRM
jgi:hypothetical protein